MSRIIAKMIEELPSNGNKFLEITEEVDISFVNNCLTFTKDRNIFEDALVLTLGDALTILSVIYTDEELLKIKENDSDFYPMDDIIQNSLLEEFDRIISEGTRYEFN